MEAARNGSGQHDFCKLLNVRRAVALFTQIAIYGLYGRLNATTAKVGQQRQRLKVTGASSLSMHALALEISCTRYARLNLSKAAKLASFTSRRQRSMQGLFECAKKLFHCVCVFSSHSFWTSMDVPAGVTQEEGNSGFSIHLLSAVLALIFLAGRIQPFLSLVDREVEFCVLTI